MASCHGCGATLVFMDTEDGRKAFDPQMHIQGPGRFREQAGVLVPIPENLQVAAYQLHEVSCMLRQPT